MRAGLAGGDLFGIQIDKDSVQPVGGGTQAGLRQRLGQRQHLLLHLAAEQDYDHQHQPALCGDELNVLEAVGAGLRCGDEAGAAGGAGQNGRGEAHPLLQLQPRLVELVANHLPLVQRQMKLAQQLLDEVAVTGLGGNASGRRVQLANVAQIA